MGGQGCVHGKVRVGVYVCVRVCVLYVCVDTSTPAQGVGSRKKDSLERGQPSAFAGV